MTDWIKTEEQSKNGSIDRWNIKIVKKTKTMKGFPLYQSVNTFLRVHVYLLCCNQRDKDWINLNSLSKRRILVHCLVLLIKVCLSPSPRNKRSVVERTERLNFWNVILVFDSRSGQTKGNKKLVFTASLLDVQQLTGQCEVFTLCGGLVAACLEDRKIPSLTPGLDNLVNEMYLQSKEKLNKIKLHILYKVTSSDYQGQILLLYSKRH